MAKPNSARATGRGRKPRVRTRKSPAPVKTRGRLAGHKVRANRAGLRPKRPAATVEQRSSKQAEVIALLRQPEGASIADVVAVTGWQPHTVRGLFSGILRKKLGLTLTSVPAERGRIYRIVETGALHVASARRGRR